MSLICRITGDLVPRSGIYRVQHDAHSLPAEVSLVADQMFPACEKCPEPVRFEFLRALTESYLSRNFSVVLCAIPVLEEDPLSLAG